MLSACELSKSFVRSVKVENTAKTFGFNKKNKKINEHFFAVDKISINVNRGEIVGILGPNGAGKTTLLRMLGGIMETETGTLEICGLTYEKNKIELKKKLAYLSNNTKLYGKFTGRELFYTMAGLFEIEKSVADDIIENLIKRFDLSSFIDNKIESMSTGQEQRVNIARTLIHSPELYILDEPTLGLDIISSKDIIDFMKSEKQNNKAVLYSTHYMEEADYLCDRVFLINKGKLLASGKTEDLKKEYDVKNIRELFLKLVEMEEAKCD